MDLHSTRTRLLMLLGVILVLGFALSNAINYVVTRQSLRAGIVENLLPLINDSIYSEIQQSFTRPLQNSSPRAHDASAKNQGRAGQHNADGIARILQTHQEKYRHQVYMIDAKGLVQAHPDASLVETLDIGQTEGLGKVAPALLANRAEGMHIYEFERGGRHLFVSARYFADLDWFLIVEYDADATLEPARRTILSNTLVGLAVTCLALLLVVRAVNRYQGRLDMLASTDELTGLCNRRHFMQLAGCVMALARCYRQPIALLMIDIDLFKAVNDTQGYDVGDRVLAALGRTLRAGVREGDIPARIGGEEFIALLPQTLEVEAAEVAHRIREEVAALEHNAPRGGTFSVTISIGTACSPDGSVSLPDLMRRADEALYRAKDAGRNCVRIG